MSIYDRLLGTAEPKLLVHSFMGLVGEFNRGKLTAAEIFTILGADASEQAELATLLAKAVPPVETISLGSLVTLTNVGTAYDNIQGLPMARVQTAGITSIEFTVRVNKVGSGTQSWQLWNETDAAETTVIDDNGATGIKILTTTRTFPAPLTAALKTFRIRAKSTTAQDDPVYLGGCVMVTRKEVLTQDVLHELLLLAESRYAYDTVATLKARLGV